jgi:gas vesicle protein
MQKNNDSLVFMSGVILGAVVGGAMALLFAPASGEETRKRLAKTSDKAMKDLKKKVDEVGDRLEPTIKNVKKELAEKVEEMREGFEKGAKAVRR